MTPGATLQPPPLASEARIPAKYVEPENIDMAPGKRDMLGMLLSKFWEDAQNQKGGGPSGWMREVEQMYRVEAPVVVGVKPTLDNDGRVRKGKGDSAQTTEFRLPQILHSRANAVVGQLSTVITRQLRIASITNGVPGEVARKKETLVHRLWQDGGFAYACRETALNGVLLNRPIWRIRPVYPTSRNPRCGVSFSSVHPDDFGVLPLGAVSTEDWQFCGEFKEMRIRRIKDKMRSGEYFDISGRIIPPMTTRPDSTGRYAHGRACIASMTSENDANLAGIVFGQVMLDLDQYDDDGVVLEGMRGEEKAYRFVLSPDTQELLSLRPYDFSSFEYFIGYLIPDPARLSGGMSLGRMLYPIQDAVNKIVSTFYEMAQRTAMPPMIGPELMSGSRYSTPPAGAYLPTDEPGQPWAPTITPQLAPLIEFCINAERWADQVARVSQNTLGTVAGRQTTATTDSIIAAGVQTGQEEYLSNFTLPFGEMALFTEELALSMMGELAAYYGTLTAVADEPDITPEEIAKRATWVATGKNPNATPSQKAADAAQISQLAEDPEFGLDKWELAHAFVENSSLVGTQVQKSKEQSQQELAAIAKAREEAEARTIQLELEKEMALKRADAEIAEEKAHNDAQRDIVRESAKAVVAQPRGGSVSGGAKKPARKG